MTDFITFLNENIILVNAGLTLVTIIVSIIAVIVTLAIARKQQKRAIAESIENKKQYMENIRIQQEQFNKQLKHSDEIQRLQERPYLILKDAGIYVVPDENKEKIKFEFKNKGKGTAFEVKPAMECNASTKNGDIKLRRYESVQDHIVMVGESFVTLFSFGFEEPLDNFITYLPIEYYDASGRTYSQTFELSFIKDGYAHSLIYAEPVLQGKG